MPQRPLWRGHVKLSLVSCPVALYSALDTKGDVRLHFINPQTGHRIRQFLVDAETEKPVDRQDLLRGYEFSKDRYVTFTEEELDEIKIESSSTMVIEKFVARDTIPPMYLDNVYYMIPDGDAGTEAFAVIHEAMAKADKFALSRLVLMRKERVIAFSPHGEGMIAYSLREAREIKPAKAYFKDIDNPKSDKDMLAITQKLIAQKSGKFDPKDFEDRYETKLRAMVDAKLKGVEIEEEPEEAPTNVIDLMGALKRSLKQGGGKGASSGGASVHRLKTARKAGLSGKQAGKSALLRKPGKKTAVRRAS